MVRQPPLEHGFPGGAATQREKLNVEHEKEAHLKEATEWQIADLIVDYLNLLEVEFVFGVPGGAIEPLYNALARSARRGGTRPIVARHETGAAFMADGYYRQTRKLAVCCSTTGPGATNLITGVASAYANEIPMLVITAQTSLTHMGRRALQESSCTGVNTVALFQHITKYNTFVSHAEQLEHKLATALMQSMQSPYGPVHLSIPTDILRSKATALIPSLNLKSLLSRPALLDEVATAELQRLVMASKKMVLVLGEGCSESMPDILKFAAETDAKIVTTPHAKGLISPYHPLYQGIVGFAGHPSATDCLRDKDVDLVLAIGTHLGEWSSDGWNQQTLLNQRLVHIDEIESHLSGSPMAQLHVRGNIRVIFQHLLEFFDIQEIHDINSRSNTNEIRQKQRTFHVLEEAKCKDDSTPLKPQRLMALLTESFPPFTRYLADSGNSIAWAVHYLHPYDRRLAGQRNCNSGLFRASLEYASMGWAIGAAVGTALGSPTTPVVCLTGDGSVLMSGQEFSVAVQEKLPVIFVILNDAALGMVKHGQRLANAEAVGFDIPQVDFAMMARSIGATGHIIESVADFKALDIKAILKNPGPTVLDVRIDGEEVPPMKTRMRVLGTVD